MNKMTKQEAKQLLEREGICPIHGIDLTQPKYNDGKFAAPFCHRCRNEVQKDRMSEIAEAKKVLGI
jgi:hypothetical protein